MTERRSPKPDLADRLAVYLVADPEQTEDDLVEVVIAAVENGVTCVQLRAKHLTDFQAWHLAIQLRQQCRARDALFLVNDRVDVALASQSDGVHLGVADLPPGIARWLGGPHFIVGYSPGTIDQVEDAKRQSADYIGLGPVYVTGSKADAGDPIGLDGLAERVAATDLPAVGIGGITVENAPDVIGAGAVGISVISAILGKPDPGAAAAALAAAVAAARKPVDG